LAEAPHSHDVVVYARTDPEDERDEVHEGVTYRYLPMRFQRTVHRVEELEERRPGLRLFASPFYHADYAFQLARELRTNPCDLVVVNNFSQFLPAIRRANPTAQVFLYMHCDWLSLLQPRQLARRLRHADLILGVSDWVTNGIRAALPTYADLCFTLHCGVDTEVFSPRDEGKGSTRRLLFISRISPEKGVHVLLDAFAQVLERAPDVELDLVGQEAVVAEGMLVALSHDARLQGLRRFYGRSYLESLMYRVGPAVASRLRFSGWIPHDQVADRCRQADVYVSASLCEAFGLGGVEAMACGLPVVATRVGGAVETVEEGATGYLVEPDDPAALAEAILRLLEDDGLRQAMGAAGRRRALELFSWGRAAQHLCELYQRGRDRAAAGRHRRIPARRRTVASFEPARPEDSRHIRHEGLR
ncbi:MAG: glycosyltransferase family 4 protein, partial [Actinomycetota bacterium]|nr:glycosyltransferase family 4 protein [Actinomycetota bacterium]